MATGDVLRPRKSLGQHWLSDQQSLAEIIDLADISQADTIVEIGPGTGFLTKLLAKKAKSVIAIELDSKLSDYLNSLNINNLTVENKDILNFNFEDLPRYKIVANIPYYLTGKILRQISEVKNRPTLAILLVQKEIADKITASAGDLSILGLTTQYYWLVDKGPVITSDKFDPPPKVDSQVVKLKPFMSNLDETQRKSLFRLIKIGFSSKRKTILNNLASGYRVDKQIIKEILKAGGIEPDRRAQTLNFDEWLTILNELKELA